MKLGLKLLALAFLVCSVACNAIAQRAPIIDVGVVVPTEVITGETLSASMVTNPRDFAGIAGLEVVPAKLPAVSGGDGANPLHNYLVNGTPADQPFTFTVSPDVVLQIRSANPASQPKINVDIPVSFPGAISPRSYEGFRMPPISLPGAMQLIHGPFSGDSGHTSVDVGGKAARIWCESPRALYFNVPAAAPIGPNLVTINDHGRKTRLKTWNLALVMSADRLKLKRGESTTFHVLIKGVETIPREAWFGNGQVPELTDPALVTKFLPDFKPPTATQPGVLVLTVENMSAGTVSMSGGDRVALKFTYGQEKYEHHGTITAKQAGGFDIDGTLIPFLHDQVGEGVPGVNVPPGADAASAAELFRRAQQWRQVALQVQEQAANNNAGQNDSTSKDAEDTVKNSNTVGDRLDQIAHNAEDSANKNPVPAAGTSISDQKLIQSLRESAKFWRDEANKARQWAHEATDEKTRKIWEDQARWEDDNAKRREELANYLEKRGGKTVAKNDPPPPPVPSTAENPVGHVPEPTPTPVAQKPPPTPTPQQSTEKKRREDCPQRGKGCVALIIDFSYDKTFEIDLETVSKKLKSAGCDVDYVTPKFKSIPEGWVIGLDSGTSTESPDDEETRANKEANKAEWARISQATATHRQRVAQGVEIAIELVNGHGSEAAPGLPCGDAEPASWSGTYLRRDDFHLGNYRAANKNVCSWFTGDFTCYGGLTPKVVDELDNLTTATCTKASSIACGNHAGWEADSSMSSAKDTKTCSNGSVWWQKGYINDALDAEIKRRAAGSTGDYSELTKALQSDAVSSATAHYSDRGYDKDKPPSHAHDGYDVNACTGGSCR